MHVFDVGSDNKLSNQKLFSDFMVDGVKCDRNGASLRRDGNLWVSSNAGRAVATSGVTVWTPEGKLLGRIASPEICGNVCLAAPKRNRLFMAPVSRFMRVPQHPGSRPGLEKTLPFSIVSLELFRTRWAPAREPIRV